MFLLQRVSPLSLGLSSMTILNIRRTCVLIIALEKMEGVGKCLADQLSLGMSWFV